MFKSVPGCIEGIPGHCGMLRSIMGCSRGVPGLFRAVPGCSGGVPGVFRGVLGVFRVLQTPHVTSEIVYMAHSEEVLINYFRDVIRYQGSLPPQENA